MLHKLILLALCFVVLGCSDATKYQAEFRGTWLLDSRKLAPGAVIRSPKISGLIEWFPTNQTKALVLHSITDDRQKIHIVEGIYDLQGTTFTYRSNLRIGSVSSLGSDAIYETSPQESSGQISSDDARVTLTHENGTKLEFIGTQLKVMHKNGAVDTWKRAKDQKGVLAK